MKRMLLAASVVGLLISALAFSGAKKTPPARSDLQISVEDRNPWTSLRLNDAPETFHFVVVSDRTGGHRARIFSEAVESINLMQPAFVVSVGDLIEGYSKDQERLAKEWKELQSYTHKLQMPFFYVPGNHDVANATEVDVWKERFGKRYYHFLYKDVLFLAMNSDDPFEEKEPRISKEQIEYFQKVLADNQKVRWTIVCTHKPAWVFPNLEKSGWLDMEKLLAGRNYTVFAGHVHRYQKFVRQGMNYYQLATTGGGSRLRGVSYGEFDHITWVTMKQGNNAPVIANLMLNGILPENLKRNVSDEEGVVALNRKAVHPVRGKVTFDGSPAAKAQIVYWLPDAKDKEGKKMTRVSDAWIEPDGTYAMSTYGPSFDGLPEGKYKVTVTLREPFYLPDGTLGKNLLPARYETAMGSPLTAEIKSGKNEVDFALSK